MHRIGCPRTEAVRALQASCQPRRWQTFLLRAHRSSVSSLLTHSSDARQYHTPQTILLATVTMPQSPPTASSSSTLQTIFVASLKEYEKKTKKDILTHPLMAQLQTCNSPTEILTILRAQVQQFEQSTSGDDKLTKWLNPTVNVLYAFSSVIGTGVGLVNSIQAIIRRFKL